MDISVLDLAGRLGEAAALGAVIGFEREVSYERGFGTLGPLLGRLEELNGTLEQLRIDDQDDAGASMRRVRLFVTVPHGVSTDDVLGDVPGLPEVRSMRVMPTD